MDTTLPITVGAHAMPMAQDHTTPYQGSAYLSYSLLTLTAIAASLGNAMVIVVIIRSNKLHNITWCLLLNLAISDFLSASVLVPMVISIQGAVDNPPGGVLCAVIGFMYTALAEASIWTLTLLSIERYFAVNQPLHYHRRVTKRRAMVAVLTLWLCVVGWGSIPFVLRTGYVFKPLYGMCLPDFSTTATLISIVLGICLPFVVLCVMYVSIGRTAFMQAQRRVIECDEENCRYVPPKNKDYRAVKILAVLAGVFATCWLPFNITTVVDAFLETPIKSLVCHLCLALTLTNAAINPWLYSILNRTFRKAAIKQLRSLQRWVLVRQEDTKVRPPPARNNIELEGTGVTKVHTQRLQEGPVQDKDVRNTPLLPNQVIDEMVTATPCSSPLQRLVSPRPETPNQTI